MSIDKHFRKLAVKALQAPLTTGARGHVVRELGPITVGFLPPPLPSARRVSVAIAQQELAWMLRGCDSRPDEHNARVTADVERIWSPWARSDGTLGPVYGVQWRDWRYPGGSIDQVEDVIYNIRDDPYSRRHIITAWNPADIADMVLPPCPFSWVFSMFQKRMWLSIFARSTDMVCGLPIDLLEGYMLLRMVCTAAGNVLPGGVTFFTANMHLYHGHEQVAEAYLDPPGFDIPPRLAFIRKSEVAQAGNLDGVIGREWKVLDYHAPVIHADVTV